MCAMADEGNPSKARETTFAKMAKSFFADYRRNAQANCLKRWRRAQQKPALTWKRSRKAIKSPCLNPSTYAVSETGSIFSQGRYPDAFGLSVDAVRHRESGRRNPGPAARALLMVIAHDPQVVMRALAQLQSSVPPQSRAGAHKKTAERTNSL